MKNHATAAREYSRVYSSDREDEAHAQRGEFLERFPKEKLSKLSLQTYAIGQNERNTFCYWVEPGTRKWAMIVGATATKFGVYFGRKKDEGELRYRYTKKFAAGLPPVGAELDAFREVKKALVALIRDGEALAFDRIDANPLSQMFKAKILSLYFPKEFLAICNGEYLQSLGERLGLEQNSLSRLQHELLVQKDVLVKGVEAWSELKYASFLYDRVLGFAPGDAGSEVDGANEGGSKGRTPRQVDFEKLMKIWRELGKRSEEYAYKFEQRRLRSIGLAKQADNILDRTDRPGYGYDFESFTSAKSRRYIEVKTLTDINSTEARFFVSENERKTSMSPEIGKNYYFYLVVYSPEREPIDVRVVKAAELNSSTVFEPQNYLVKVARKANGGNAI